MPLASRLGFVYNPRPMTRNGYIFRRAFRDSLPILVGYGTMGFAAGVVFAARSGTDAPALWSAALAVSSFSGTLQFAVCDWFRRSAPLAAVALMTLAISFRYALYGFALVSRWRGVSKLRKLFLVAGLADENAALEIACPLKKKDDFVRYCTILTALDLAYWTIGATAGALAGSALPIPDRGIEFVMAALFIAILTDQVRGLVSKREEAKP